MKKDVNAAPRHWVFDLDGTLVDSFSHYFLALTDIFREQGVEFTDDLKHTALTEELTVFFERTLGPRLAPSALAQLRTRSQTDAQHIRAFEGVAPTLQGLRARGDRVAVWTNRDLDSARLILRHSGLAPHIENCISGTCVERKKPDSEGLRRMIGFFECSPAHVTMVGDHEYDVAAGKELGTTAVRASWHGAWAVAPCPIADHQFYSFSRFAHWANSPIQAP